MTALDMELWYLFTFILWNQVKSHWSSPENLTSEVTPKGHFKLLGSHQPPEGHIKEIWDMPNASAFYHQYVAPSQPVIFKGAAKISSSYNLWTDNYLSNKYGNIKVNVDYGKKENRERPADVMTLQEFLEIYNTSERYLVDSVPRALQHEFLLPKCILCGGFTKRLQDSVIWFSSGGTKSFLHIDNVENINCLLSGEKEWFFVDQENSRNIEIDHGEGEYCGVDVDKVDMFKYPSLQTMPWWAAGIKSGDCIYIPHGWAHQVRSYSRNLAVNIWWTPMKNFNESDCNDESKVQGMPLSSFQFTHGEQLRFLILNVVEKHGGKITYDTIHDLILDEHTGQHLVSEKSFSLLDENNDGILVVEEIESQPAEIIEIALQRSLPGNVNIRGMSQKVDPKLQQILKELEKQEPYVEEFLLRLHKTPDDVRKFLEKHHGNLNPEIIAYLLEKIQESHNSNIQEEL